jgi:ERCC4-type nuclease
MKLTLIIDTRETGSVAKELDILNVPYTIEPLSVGDFLIKNEETDLAVWERKTCADLSASVNDGRYAEQKGRLFSLTCKWKGYILEGYYPESNTNLIPRSTIDSIKLGLSMRDNFIIHEVANSKHTAIFLMKMLKKIPEYLKENVQDRRDKYDDALIKSMSIIRKDNMTPELCFISQLCQIPGISYTIAQSIKDRFANMKELLNNLNFKLLSEVQCSASRKLGKVLATRIIEYMSPQVKVPEQVKSPSEIVSKEGFTEHINTDGEITKRKIIIVKKL